MLKLTKKADYGLIAMRHLAQNAGGPAFSAKDLAEQYGIPTEALAKILQRLAKARLLVSLQGTNGGYALARDARTISALEVIRTIEGPLFLTSCSSAKGDCGQSERCTVREPLRKVSRTIEEVLSQLTVWELAEPSRETRVALVRIGDEGFSRESVSPSRMSAEQRGADADLSELHEEEFAAAGMAARIEES